jgi:hypothetical protein
MLEAKVQGCALHKVNIANPGHTVIFSARRRTRKNGKNEIVKETIIRHKYPTYTKLWLHTLRQMRGE